MNKKKFTAENDEVAEGVMINFNVELLKHGIRRKMLDFSEDVSL